MCDYSLMAFPNRLARESEDLVVHRFSSGSLGLASPPDLYKASQPAITCCRSWWKAFQDWFTPPQTSPVTAVCIPPSAHLILRDISSGLQSEYGLQPEEEVTFVQLSAEPHTYRDAVRFRNGRSVRLQDLREGQRVTVVDLGDAEPVKGDGPGALAAVGRDVQYRE